MSDDAGMPRGEPLTDDELDEIGTRAGHALRSAAPEAGPVEAIRSAHRRRAASAVGTGALLAVAIAGAVTLMGPSSDEDVPAAPTPSMSGAPTTSPQRAPTSTPMTTAVSTSTGQASSPTAATTPLTFELGARTDLTDALFPLELTGDGSAIARQCPMGDNSRCEVELIEAQTLLELDSVPCPIGWVDGEPYMDPAAMDAFMHWYPNGDTSTGDSAFWGTLICRVSITDEVVLAHGGNAARGHTVAFDAESGVELWRRPDATGLLSPDGTVVVTRTDTPNTPRLVIDARSGEVLRQLDPDLFLSFDPTGRYNFAPTARITDVQSGEVVFESKGARGAFFDPQGLALLVLHDDRVQVVDTSTWTMRWTMPSGNVWDDASGAELGVGDFTIDGSLLAIGIEPRIIDARTGAVLGEVPDACGEASLEFYKWLPDGRTLILECVTQDGESSWLQQVLVTTR